MQEVDVLVIGGGPGGASAATTLARAGRSVLLVDKATFPRDKCCGDGLTSGALRRLDALGLDPSNVASWQWVDDVELSSSRRTIRSFPLPTGPGHFAAIATRVDLDAAILDLARLDGALVWEDTLLTAISDTATGIRATVQRSGESEQVVASHVVAADGMWSTTRKLLGAATPTSPTSPTSPIPTPTPTPTPTTSTSPSTSASVSVERVGPYLGEWHGYRQYARNVHTEASRKLWIWFEPDLLPGYLWSFPLANGRVNLGFGIARTADRPTKDMKSLWSSLIARPNVAAVLGPDIELEAAPKAWPIPANIGSAPLASGRVLFVGDAARACDVLTGEGIGQALQTGIAAADSILAERRGDAHAAGRRYTERVLAEMGPDHQMSGWLEDLIAKPWICEAAIRLSGSTNWTRRNFARWLFEDYARGIALTPTKWRWGLMSGAGAYERLRP